MSKGSDNPFPSVLLVETASASVGTPGAGRRRLFVDTDNVLKWKDEAGAVQPVAALNKWDGTVAPTANEDSGDGYAVGSRWIDTTADKEYVCLDASVGAAVWTETTQAGGAGSSAWTEVITESGTSFANFTAAAGGTWSSDGTVIKQTNTTATQRRASHNTKVSALKVVESDIKLVATNASRGGFLLTLPDAEAAGGLVVYINGSGIFFEYPEATTARGSFTATVNSDTWYTLKCLHSGSFVTVWLDGTLVGTRDVVSGGQDQRDTGLYTYNGEVHFRNYSVNTLTLP